MKGEVTGGGAGEEVGGAGQKTALPAVAAPSPAVPPAPLLVPEPVTWSPLQLSSFNLAGSGVSGPGQVRGLKPRPPARAGAGLRTETLERHPSRSNLRSFTSGRCSAEPLDWAGRTGPAARPGLGSLPHSLSELDLRNIEPEVAASLLEQIEAGADVEPILIQLKHLCAKDSANVRNKDKMVTFQEDFSVQNM